MPNTLRDLFTGLAEDLEKHNLIDSQKLLDFLRAAHPEVNEPEPEAVPEPTAEPAPAQEGQS